MSEVKEYISNITIPDGTTKYVKDAELTEDVNELSTKVATIETNISDLVSKTDTTNTNVSINSSQIKTNQSNILTNTNKIGENSADIKTAKSDISTAKSDIITAKSDIVSLKKTVDEMIDKIYPVGSIYLAMNTTNPSLLFGGTWERIKDRFLLGCGDSYTSIGTYGGEESHTLTVDEIPSHQHDSQNYFTGEPQESYRSDTDKYFTPMAVKSGGGGTEATLKGAVMSTGGNKPHNNMPPYVTCYIWQRTA